MQPDGDYGAARRPATLADLNEHFACRQPRGFVALDAPNGYGRFIGFDVDKRARSLRIPLLA